MCEDVAGGGRWADDSSKELRPSGPRPAAVHCLRTLPFPFVLLALGSPPLLKSPTLPRLPIETQPLQLKSLLLCQRPTCFGRHGAFARRLELLFKALCPLGLDRGRASTSRPGGHSAPRAGGAVAAWRWSECGSPVRRGSGLRSNGYRGGGAVRRQRILKVAKLDCADARARVPRRVHAGMRFNNAT